jgi:transposase/predicted NAD-dependent protein-ADP-ribosyltransferase YbiA (DUF1768 family)
METLLRDRIEFCSSKRVSNGMSVDYLTNFKRLSQPIVLTKDIWASPLCAALRAGFSHINPWWSFLEPPRLEFATSEHLWQALKTKNLKTFLRFTATGDLGNLTLAFFEKIYAGKSAKGKPVSPHKKFDLWNRNGMAGIVAKMASNPTYGARLGLSPGGDMDYAREHLDPAVERSVWLEILALKFAACPVARQQLLGTGGRYLLEWSKGAERETRSGRVPHWNGLVGKDGVLYGENIMGQYLMATRLSIQTQFV